MLYIEVLVEIVLHVSSLMMRMVELQITRILVVIRKLCVIFIILIQAFLTIQGRRRHI